MGRGAAGGRTLEASTRSRTDALQDRWAMTGAPSGVCSQAMVQPPAAPPAREGRVDEGVQLIRPCSRPDQAGRPDQAVQPHGASQVTRSSDGAVVVPRTHV